VNIGKLSLQGNIISASDRLHLSSPEHVFLLPKGGDVNVSKAWGGNGNLNVDGNLVMKGYQKYALKIIKNIGYDAKLYLNEAVKDFSKDDPDGTTIKYLVVFNNNTVLRIIDVVKYGNQLFSFITYVPNGQSDYFSSVDWNSNIPGNGNDGFRKSL